METPREATILVVDDEPLFRSSVEDALRYAHPRWRILSAADGVEALAEVNATPPDVVVTDLDMPRLDGFELMSALSLDHYGGAIIVITTFGTTEIEHKVRDLGASSFLAKPVEMGTLIRAVEEATLPRKGILDGLTVQGFSQLLEVEGKTCSIKVRSDSGTGWLSFEAGILVDARTRHEQGNAAALDILGWTETTLELERRRHEGAPTVDLPLNKLLLDSAIQKDADAAEPPQHDTQEIVLTSAVLNGSDTADGHPPNATPEPTTQENRTMSNVSESLAAALEIDGAIGVTLVDFESGMSLGAAGGGFDLDVAAAGNTEVVRSKMQVMQNLGLDDAIEDILITLGKQYHIIRPLKTATNLFLYLALDRKKSNLAMARHKLSSIENSLKV